MQTVDRLAQIRDASGVVQHIVRRRQTGLAAGLRRQNRASLLGGAAVSRLRTLYLQRFIRIDNQHAIDPLACIAALDEQGNGHHHIRSLRRSDLKFHFGADERMQNGVQRPACLGIVEYSSSQV